MRLKQIGFIDEQYIKLCIVHLKHIQFISIIITQIWPDSFKVITLY